MKARILPLKGKYYGTRIDTEAGTLDVWLGLPTAPSARQMAEWEPLEDDLSEYTCDGHYETDLSYRVAEAIVNALAGVEYAP